MRIVTWNCNGAFRKKFSYLNLFNADILVIQECEDPSQAHDINYKVWASNFIWTSEDKNKGLGIFCKNNITMEDNAWVTNGLKYFLSVKINRRFDLIGIWNHHANSPNFGYIGQFWKYLQINKSLMDKSLIVGDFNSNKIWDESDRWWNHSDVVRELEEIGIRSIYHEYFKENQGEEKTATFFLHRDIQRPYHIDYVFAHKKILGKVIEIQIGDKAIWLSYSDHLPIVFEF